MMEETRSFECPYCGAVNSFTPDFFGGRRQTISEECSVCDKSIRLELEWEGDELIRLDAFQETE